MINQEPLFDVFHPSPLLVVISGPSGVGKDAVLQSLKDHHLSFHFVVTATSRAPRPGEKDGIDYHFITAQQFEELIAHDELIEHALVYDQYKGIPKDEVRNAFKSGKDVVMRLDVQGATKIRQLFPEAVLIFLIPANDQEWYDRLRNRKTEDEECLKIREATARKEMESYPIFDYVVVNAQGHLDETAENIIAIIDSEHRRVHPRRVSL